jgi:hypothetical protein
MDRTGRVNGVYMRLRMMQQAEALRREQPPLTEPWAVQGHRRRCAMEILET